MSPSRSAATGPSMAKETMTPVMSEEPILFSALISTPSIRLKASTLHNHTTNQALELMPEEVATDVGC